MGKLSGKFTEQKEFKKYFGVAGVRIVTDEKGQPIINPTNAQLSKIYEDFNSENEREYTGIQKLSWGWDNFKDKGGNKRISAEDFASLPFNDREGVISEEEVDFAKVSMVLEVVDKNVKEMKIITFRFLNCPEITKNGDKKKVFNRFGKFTYMSADGAFGIENYEKGKEDLVKACPMGTGHLDFEDFVNFLYAYSTLSKKVPLLEDLNLDQILKGNMQSVSSIIMDIHSDIKTNNNEPAYGAMVLFTVENNNSTGNEFRQSYYHMFERMFMDNSLRVNESFSRILKTLADERKPSKNGVIYSPESKGIFVGHNGAPKFGLAEFKNNYVIQAGYQMEQHSSGQNKGSESFKNPFEQGGGSVVFS